MFGLEDELNEEIEKLKKELEAADKVNGRLLALIAEMTDDCYEHIGFNHNALRWKGRVERELKAAGLWKEKWGK